MLQITHLFILVLWCGGSEKLHGVAWLKQRNNSSVRFVVAPCCVGVCSHGAGLLQPMGLPSIRLPILETLDEIRYNPIFLLWLIWDQCGGTGLPCMQHFCLHKKKGIRKKWCPGGFGSSKRGLEGWWESLMWGNQQESLGKNISTSHVLLHELKCSILISTFDVCQVLQSIF